MATWSDLSKFVNGEYEVLGEQADEIRVMVGFEHLDDEDERTQLIILTREVLDKQHEWVQIASPIGVADVVDLKALLVEVGQTSIVGGIAIIGDHVVLRHSLPLADMDANEFVDPLNLIAGTADQLEEIFFGGDQY